MSELTQKNVASVCSNIPTKGYTREFWQKYRPNSCKGLGVGKALDTMKAAGLKNGNRSLNGMTDIAKLQTIQQASTVLTSSLSKAHAKAKGDPVAQKYIAAFKKDVGGPFDKALTEALQAATGNRNRQQENADEARLNREYLNIYSNFNAVGEKHLKDYEAAQKDANASIEAMNSFMGKWLNQTKAKGSDPEWLAQQLDVARKGMAAWDKKARIYKSAYAKIDQKNKDRARIYKGLPKPGTAQMKQEMVTCKQLYDTLEGVGEIVQERFRIFFKGYNLHTQTLAKMEAALKKLPNPAAEGM